MEWRGEGRGDVKEGESKEELENLNLSGSLTCVLAELSCMR